MFGNGVDPKMIQNVIVIIGYHISIGKLMSLPVDFTGFPIENQRNHEKSYDVIPYSYPLLYLIFTSH
jgi:hypothetical protein